MSNRPGHGPVGHSTKAASIGAEASIQCSEVAELLPFFLNRSLELSWMQAIESHLASCAHCRREEIETRAAWDLNEGHLPVEQILDYALGESISNRRRAVIESHLAACERCAGEVSAVRQQETEPQQEPGVMNLAPPNARRRWMWAACFAAMIASVGWLWTLRQLSDALGSSARPAIRANLPVVELVPTTGGFLLRRGGGAEPDPQVVTAPATASELVFVLLSGGKHCETGCTLEIYAPDSARPPLRLEGLMPTPEGHLTLILPSQELAPGASTLTIFDTAAGQLRVEYRIERRAP